MRNQLNRVASRLGTLVTWLLGLLSRRKPGGNDQQALRLLALDTSRPVPELASGLGVSPANAMTMLAGLERRGLVRLSPDKGGEHVRIAAITARGRENIRG